MLELLLVFVFGAVIFGLPLAILAALLYPLLWLFSVALKAFGALLAGIFTAVVCGLLLAGLMMAAVLLLPLALVFG